MDNEIDDVTGRDVAICLAQIMKMLNELKLNRVELKERVRDARQILSWSIPYEDEEVEF